MNDARATRDELLSEIAALRREVGALRLRTPAPSSAPPAADQFSLFDVIDDALVVVRLADGVILHANPRSLALLGCTAADAVGRPMYDLIPARSAVRVREVMGEVARRRLVPVHEVQFHRPDGGAVPLRVTGGVVGEGDQTLALVYLKDTSDVQAARRRLDEVEERHRLLVESAQDPIFVVAGDSRFLAANPAAGRYMHSTPEAMIGKTMGELFPPAIAARQMAAIRRVIETGRPLLSEENQSMMPDGPRWFNTTLSPLRDAGGRVTSVLGIARDVTERKRTEAALRDSEARYRAVVDCQSELIARVVPDGTISFANEAVCRFFGHDRHEILGSNIDLYMLPEDRAAVKAQFTHLGPDRPVVETEPRVLTAAGEVRWLHWANYGIFDEAGRLVEIQAVGRDVTERKAAEESLRESEARYRAVVESQSELISRVLPDGTLTFVNEAFCRFFSRSCPEMLGLSINSYIPPEDQEAVHEALCGLRPERSCVELEHRVIVTSGEMRWVHWSNCGIFDDAGRLIEIQGAGRDVTDRKAAEEALRESEQKYRDLFEHNIIGVVVIDDQGRILHANRAYADIFGVGVESMIGRDAIAYYHSDDQAKARERTARFVQHGPDDGERQYRALRADGTIAWVEVRSRRIPWEGRPALQVLVRDISRRKAGEAALRQSENNYRSLFEQSLDGVVVLVDGRIVRVNPAAAAMYGRDAAELLSHDMLGFVHPDEHAAALAHFQAVMAGETVSSRRYRTRRADGTYALVEAAANRIEWEGRPGAQVIVRDVTGQALMEEQLREALKMEAVGQLAGGVAHDFNNLMTGILCHTDLLKLSAESPVEVRAAATHIEGAARRAARLTEQLLGFARGGKQQNVPVDVNAAIRTAVDLLRGTLDCRLHVVTRLTDGPVYIQGDPVQIEQVVINLAMNARDAMPNGGRMTLATERVDLDAAACVARPDAKPGRYVALIVSDTGRGIPEDLRRRIFEPFFTTKPRGKGVGMGLAMVYGIARNHGGWAEVESEEGRGATFRILLPQATGEPSEESGEGAAAAAVGADAGPAGRQGHPGGKDDRAAGEDIVWRREDMSRRSEDVARRDEDAALWTEDIARRTEDVARRVSAPAAKQMGGGTPARTDSAAGRGPPRILVIDDEPLVRNVVSVALRQQGYDVVSAADGQEAVDALRRLDGLVDLAIIDMVMPGMDGHECFLALREINPSLRAVLSTGWASEGTLQKVLESGMLGLIQKPYQADQLVAAVRRYVEA